MTSEQLGTVIVTAIKATTAPMSVEQAAMAARMTALEARQTQTDAAMATMSSQMTSCLNDMAACVSRITALEGQMASMAAEDANEGEMMSASLARVKADAEALRIRVASVEEDLRTTETIIREWPIPRDGRDGIDGKDGAPGRDGVDGKDGADGAPGERGADAIVDLNALALKAAELIPMAKDGRDGINGKDGADGLNGKDGKDGIDGKEGPEGKPGRDGRDGLPGVQGEKGLDGKDGRDGTNGKDGLDGLGFDDIDEEIEDSGRVVVRRYRSGDRVKEFRHLTGVVIYRGVWVEGHTYERGDMVTWAGSTWHAKERTTAKPGESSAASRSWTLAVKVGRDGKQGPQGPQGAQGDRGPAGRDGRNYQ